MSKHEALFSVSRHFIGRVLQVVQLTLTVFVAWCFISLASEISEILQLVGTVEANTAIPIRLVLPCCQISLLLGVYNIMGSKLPESLRTYVLATSLEMMKDRSAVDTVIQQ